MAQPVVDISMLGDKALVKALSKFEPRIQKKVVRGALRKSTTRLKRHLITNFSGRIVGRGPEPEHWREAQKATRNRMIKASRHRIGAAIPMPTRELLGIDPKDKYYYPYAVEYGHPRAAAKMPIRLAADEHKTEEYALIGRGIGIGIEREAMKAMKR